MSATQRKDDERWYVSLDGEHFTDGPYTTRSAACLAGRKKVSSLPEEQYIFWICRGESLDLPARNCVEAVLEVLRLHYHGWPPPLLPQEEWSLEARLTVALRTWMKSVKRTPPQDGPGHIEEIDVRDVSLGGETSTEITRLVQLVKEDDQ